MTFIDFFSGIGGMRSGLEKAGHKCVGFCECIIEWFNEPLTEDSIRQIRGG